VISRRAMLGGTIIAAWLVGLGLLIRREYFQPRLERLAEAGHRVAPGVVYYGVMQGERHVGFASSTVDTSESSITIDDYFVADLPFGGRSRRTSARTNVTLSRALRMRKFNVSVQADGPAIDATGDVSGDSVLVLSIASGKEKPETQRIALSGPILLPTLIPLAVALGEGPKVGRHYVLPVFDPSTMTPHDVGVDVRAESLFVVDDSAVVDSATQRWRGVDPDTIRSWQVTSQSKGAFSGWIDDHGRIMQTTQLGFVLRRMPYEVAFANWRADTSHAVASDRDILETTAIAANKRMDKRIDALRVRLSNVDLSGFDVDGQRQRLDRDTLVIAREPDSALVAPYQLNGRLLARPQDSATTRPEPLLQSTDRRIVGAALRIRQGQRDPRVVAERINTWVHDSISNRVTLGVPNALEVLRTRRGDCNEHTQLFVALARAIGLPARVAAGLAYVDGKFYYHAWPEVLLGDWVPVDPTFGQFPADAAHIRFVIGGLPRQTELLRLMGNLKIDVLSVNAAR